MANDAEGIAWAGYGTAPYSAIRLEFLRIRMGNLCCCGFDVAGYAPEIRDAKRGSLFSTSPFGLD